MATTKSNPRYDVGLFLLRLGLGSTMLFFGSQKMIGVFGGAGYSGTIEGFTKMGIHPAFANLAIAGEFFGGLGVLLGCLTPIAAFGIACTMAYATYITATSRVLHEIFTNGQAMDTPRVFLSGSLFFSALAVMIMGAGQFSLDALLFGKRRK